MRPLQGLLVIFGVFFLFLLLGSVISGLFDFRTDELTETFTVTPSAGVTTVNVTLTQDLWEDSAAYAAATSNETADGPSASIYYFANRDLEISGLAENITRTITVVYYTDGLGDYTGAGDAIQFGPTMLVAAIVALAVIALVVSLRR